MPGLDADSIERMARTSADSRALRTRVVSALRRSIHFEWYVFVLTDPRTTVGVDPLAEIPGDVDLPRLIRARYLTTDHRWTSLSAAAAWRPGGASDDIWQDVVRRHGVVELLSAVLRDRHGCWGFIDLWSTRGFGTVDARRLDGVTAALTTVLRRAQAATLRQGPALPPAGPVVLVLEDSLRVSDRTAPAADWLARLLPPQEGVPAVPAVAYNVAAQLVSVERGVDDHPPVGRVHLGSGAWITVRAARLGEQIAVAMEPTGASDRIDLVGRAFSMSPRERTVLAQICAGGTTSSIAETLRLSPLTVQDHLKSTFDRTGVRSRRELVSLVLGAVPAGG